MKTAQQTPPATEAKTPEPAKVTPAAAEPIKAAPAQPVQTQTEDAPKTEDKPAATPAVTEPAPATEAATHTVVNGDNLWIIARDRLGDGHRFREIIELNPDLKRRPNALTPGQVLKLPVKN
ncbi:LysM peptidoglycan-binding domain-containing protein [Rhizobium sp. FKL33]|uniref:LysM peptidoglycan-binding domain-containing protein n=1 Tax=Rhizobium sp. FKL33 TaxID=2562307 RepID=UPI001FED6E7F|nr:LysM peptidoglycan-binding domain-containing protein [Rhizobium sp. FKL33]